jgi:hypothetical protein
MAELNGVIVGLLPFKIVMQEKRSKQAAQWFAAA